MVAEDLALAPPSDQPSDPAQRPARPPIPVSSAMSARLAHPDHFSGQRPRNRAPGQRHHERFQAVRRFPAEGRAARRNWRDRMDLLPGPQSRSHALGHRRTDRVAWRSASPYFQQLHRQRLPVAAHDAVSAFPVSPGSPVAVAVAPAAGFAAGATVEQDAFVRPGSDADEPDPVGLADQPGPGGELDWVGRTDSALPRWRNQAAAPAAALSLRLPPVGPRHRYWPQADASAVPAQAGSEHE